MPIRCLYGSPSEISPDHWQGGFPLDGDKLHRAGFDTLVLCASELQPCPVGSVTHRTACAVAGEVVDFEFPGVEVVMAPMEDVDAEGQPTAEEVALAREAAARTLIALSHGRRVLVSCQAGRNRSGLVSALILVERYGLSGRTAAEVVRLRRKCALTNDAFSAYLNGVRAPAK